jgi:hypothetical protein
MNMMDKRKNNAMLTPLGSAETSDDTYVMTDTGADYVHGGANDNDYNYERNAA